MIHLDICTSTNDYLLHNPGLQPQERILLVSTDEQTAGRGQTGNTWVSDRSSNLLFSMRVRPQGLAASGGFVLSQATALSIMHCLQHCLPQDTVCIKWPNDIYVRDSKICGILIENTLQGKFVRQSVIGCGININQEHFPDGLAAPATSLRLLTGDVHEPATLLRDIHSRFSRYYGMIEDGDLLPIRQEYHRHLLWCGQQQTFQDSAGTFLGTIQHVEDDGHLIIRDQAGTLRKYAFKEIKRIKQ